MDNIYIDKTALVESSDIGENTKIWRNTHIMSSTRIGKNVIIGENVFIGKNVVVGDGCKIQNGSQIFDGVILDKQVFVGPHVVFTNIINPRAFIERKNEYKTTIVKQGVSIGANATIICGNTLGKYSFIAAGAVVPASIIIYNNAMIIGVPAKQRGWICNCGCKLNNNICEYCNKKYKITEKSCTQE